MAEERPLASEAIAGTTLIIAVIWNQSWILIGRAEAGTPILWPPDVKNFLMGNDPDAGKDWRQEKEGTTEDEMVEWHHWLDGHEFEQALGVGDGQGSLACCSLWGCKELDTTSWLNWTKVKTHCWHIQLLGLEVASMKQPFFQFPQHPQLSSPSLVRGFPSLQTFPSFSFIFFSMYNCPAFLHSFYFLALSLLGSFSSYHFLYLLNSTLFDYWV